MSTTNSLRALARGEQAYRKHLKARRDQNGNSEASFGDSDHSGKKGWTFSKLEYLNGAKTCQMECLETLDLFALQLQCCSY